TMSLFNLWLLSLPTGHTELEFRQIPSYQVTEKGTAVILRCDPISGHLLLHCYRQILGQKVEFLILFDKVTLLEKSQTFKDRFSAGRPDGSFWTLRIQPRELGDSAV
ncbi:hypothetical protein PANDA_013485, partial [Ailuropoda melanoleuca]